MPLTSNLTADEASSVANTDADEGHHESRTLRRVIWAMTIILGVSLAVNVLLAYKIRQANQSSAALKAPRLSAGTAVLPINAQSLDGGEAAISAKDSSQPLVLYVFTPQCIWCL